MLKLAEMYITGSTEERLDDLLERYNAEHPDDKMSYQDYCKMLLEDAIYTKHYRMTHPDA